MSTTEDDNHHHQQPWSTWDELLLASAVKRHGCRNWDSVVSQLQSRTKLLTTPDSCRLKFQDLRRRFAAVDGGDDDGGDLAVPLIEDLKRLRLDELRAEVNRHDLSISSLQMKVKRLEQDREQSLKEGEEAEKSPDLQRSDHDTNNITNHDDVNNNNRRDDEEADRVADDGEDQESDPENQSVNGSNSTGPNKPKDHKSGQIEPDQIRIEPKQPEPSPPGSKRVESSGTSRGEESSDSIAKALPIELKKEKAAESNDGGAKTDSDVQSSATLSKKRRREKVVTKSEEADGGAKIKSEPLINVLALVRSHKDASLFERRSPNQETMLYKNVVRQHMDLQMIQNNLESGCYALSSHLNFFRDLLLVFTNCIIFYPKSSPEFKAAQELRAIVSDKIDEQYKQSQISEEKLSYVPTSPYRKSALERSDSIVGKQKAGGGGGGPIVVCRKRSSVTGKGNLNGKGEQQSDVGVETKTVLLADLKQPSSPKEERSLLNSKAKDKTVTGTRSLRRSNNNPKPRAALSNATAAATTSNSNKKETASTTVSATIEKKKDESSASKKDDTSAKKRGAADFLKRLKGNSPVKSKDVKSEAKNSATKGNNSGEQKKKNINGDKVDGRRKITTRQSDQGKQSSKTEGAATSPTKRNVGRPSKKIPESAGTKRGLDAEAVGSDAPKQPKKRTRR